MPSETISPRVLRSYSHDSDPHKQKILALADRLRADGVDACIDHYVMAPPEGWPRWTERQIGYLSRRRRPALMTGRSRLQ